MEAVDCTNIPYGNSNSPYGLSKEPESSSGRSTTEGFSDVSPLSENDIATIAEGIQKTGFPQEKIKPLLSKVSGFHDEENILKKAGANLEVEYYDNGMPHFIEDSSHSKLKELAESYLIRKTLVSLIALRDKLTEKSCVDLVSMMSQFSPEIKKIENKIDLLIAALNSANVKDKEGNTPLMNAILKSDVGLVKLLAEYGSTTEAERNKAGQTVFELAGKLPDGDTKNKIEEILTQIREGKVKLCTFGAKANITETTGTCSSLLAGLNKTVECLTFFLGASGALGGAGGGGYGGYLLGAGMCAAGCGCPSCSCPVVTTGIVTGAIGAIAGGGGAAYAVKTASECATEFKSQVMS